MAYNISPRAYVKGRCQYFLRLTNRNTWTSTGESENRPCSTFAAITKARTFHIYAYAFSYHNGCHWSYVWYKEPLVSQCSIHAGISTKCFFEISDLAHIIWLCSLVVFDSSDCYGGQCVLSRSFFETYFQTRDHMNSLGEKQHMYNCTYVGISYGTYMLALRLLHIVFQREGELIQLYYFLLLAYYILSFLQ